MDRTNFQNQKEETRKFCSAKKRTLQTFVMKKADTTNFCSLKKRTLQTFVMKKADTTNFSGGWPRQI